MAINCMRPSRVQYAIHEPVTYPRTIRQFSKQFTQVFIEHAVFLFLFLSTSCSHSLCSSSNCRHCLLCLFFTHDLQNRRAKYLCQRTCTGHYTFMSTIAIYKPLLGALYVLNYQWAIILLHTCSANQQAIRILHCWQSLVQPISELLHFFALFTCTKKRVAKLLGIYCTVLTMDRDVVIWLQ